MCLQWTSSMLNAWLPSAMLVCLMEPISCWKWDPPAVSRTGWNAASNNRADFSGSQFIVLLFYTRSHYQWIMQIEYGFFCVDFSILVNTRCCQVECKANGIFNPLKPSGYFTYTKLNIKKCYILSKKFWNLWLVYLWRRTLQYQFIWYKCAKSSATLA